jgi:hypothetical protein
MSGPTLFGCTDRAARAEKIGSDVFSGRFRETTEMRWIACGVISLGLLAGAVRAEEASTAPCSEDPAHTMPKKGWPDHLSRLARPSESPQNVGYFVGGGSPRASADPPSPHEGTWGWDYKTRCINPRIMLNWWHNRYQGGTGAYTTDGPHICPKK